MPCPNALQASARHPASMLLRCFAIAAHRKNRMRRRSTRDERADPAKFVCRARHAVPLLRMSLSGAVALTCDQVPWYCLGAHLRTARMKLFCYCACRGPLLLFDIARAVLTIGGTGVPWA